jgi:hypothetical protein
MDASAISVVYTGTLELDLRSDGSVEPNPDIEGTMLDTPSLSVDLDPFYSTSSCSFDILDLLAAVAGFPGGFTGFVDDAAATGMNSLASDIEAEIEWQYAYGGYCEAD